MKGQHLNKNDHGNLIQIESVKIDPLNQVGVALAKGFLLKAFKGYHEAFQKQICKFIVERKKSNYFEDLLWFSKDKEELRRIISEGYEVVKRLDWKFDQALIDQIAQKSQVNSDILNSSESLV